MKNTNNFFTEEQIQVLEEEYAYKEMNEMEDKIRDIEACYQDAMECGCNVECLNHAIAEIIMDYEHPERLNFKPCFDDDLYPDTLPFS